MYKQTRFFHFYFCLFLLFFGMLDNQCLAQSPKDSLRVAYFASGCFWCVETIFESVDGVEEAVSGYSGGQEENPSYESTSSGVSGHAETVAVYYNPSKISYQNLLTVYFGSQNPTTYGQFPDFGSAYRSGVFHQNKKEKKAIDSLHSILNRKIYGGKMQTEILPFEKFYKAEEEHQDFEKNNPNNRYIQKVSIPRLERFQRMFVKTTAEGF
jgi:peptide-methionine (S)-S-oxide reductase